MSTCLFEPSFESLCAYEAPEWFRDAKFGIWAHWGPQSVPMFGDWYARNMYIQGTWQYNYHLRHYGHPSKFGYKDLCALWKAEKFDPEGLMDRFVRSGAKYFMALATHHDHFFCYDSALNPMNSVNVGPRKDIVGLWQAAAKKRGLPFGLSEHLAASFSWWRVNKGCDRYGPYAGVPYDGNDPAWRHFYHDNAVHGTENPEAAEPWYTDDPAFRCYWLRCVREMIDRYKPDILYTDGSLPFGGVWDESTSLRPVNEKDYTLGLEAVAHLYNTSIELYGANRAVFLQKDRNPMVASVGVLDVEKSQLPAVAERPWHTDTCIGWWFYDVHRSYKRPEQIIEMLVDIVSKNGCMLLNVLQRPDGTIDEEAEYILDELGKWFAFNGEAVYGTRPWDNFAEGKTRVEIGGFKEEKTGWTPMDYRFTQKNGVVYAFMMGVKPGREAVLESFRGRRIRSVRLLGAENVSFSTEDGKLVVQLPDRLPSLCANTLAITME